jgi:hypothetical protein
MPNPRMIHAMTLATAATAALCTMSVHADEKPAASAASTPAAMASGQVAHKPRHHRHTPAATHGETTTRTVEPQTPAPVKSSGTQTGTDSTVGIRRSR